MGVVTSPKPFQQKLRETSQKNHSLLCVGLDPEPSFVPRESVVSVNRMLIKATAGLACAYKPNLAFYEAMGAPGIEALHATLDAVREADPDTPIIGDAKRGDIGSSSLAYAETLFDKLEFDAVTVHPYMGFDSLEPFLDRTDQGIFILCRTSNRGGKDLQNLMVVGDGEVNPRPLYQVVASLAQGWNKNGNVGLVLGATYPDEIGGVRQICPDMPFLIPGIGAQGGDLPATVSNAINTEGGGFLINVARQIMYSARDSDGTLRTDSGGVEAVRKVARDLRDRINQYRAIATSSGPQPVQG